VLSLPSNPAKLNFEQGQVCWRSSRKKMRNRVHTLPLYALTFSSNRLQHLGACSYWIKCPVGMLRIRAAETATQILHQRIYRLSSDSACAGGNGSDR
jgi:hypothetical protein